MTFCFFSEFVYNFLTDISIYIYKLSVYNTLKSP